MTDATAARMKKPRRRWLQFGLRTLMLVTLLVAIAMAWLTRPETVVDFLPDGGRIERQVIRDGEDHPLEHGRWRLFDAEGRLLVDGHYRGGQPRGRWTYYDEAGGKRRAGEARQSLREGAWTGRHADGSMASEVAYRAGLPDGPARTSWPAGGEPKRDGAELPVRWEGEYRDGRRVGRWRFRDERGRPLAEGHYVAGREEGPWRRWDEAGRELPPVTYHADVRVPADAEAIVERWIARLRGGGASQRTQAAWALARIGPPALPRVMALLGDDNAGMRRAAAEILAAIGPPAAESVDALLAAVADDDAAVALAAVEALGRIGPAAKNALPAIVGRAERAADDDERAVFLAAQAAIHPGDAAAVRGLLLLRPPNGRDILPPADSQSGGWSTWPEVYEQRPGLALPLRTALGDDDLRVALLAVRALVLLRHAHPDAESALREALLDSRAEVRLEVIEQLLATTERLSKATLDAIAPLAEHDASPVVRDAAQKATDPNRFLVPRPWFY